MTGFRALAGVLRYWRSFGWSPFSWGWLVGLVAAGLLAGLGRWGIPFMVLALALFIYLTSGTKHPQAWRSDEERRDWSRIEKRRPGPPTGL